MAFLPHNDAPWIFDSYACNVEQRAVSDADFTDDVTYDGVVWDEFATASVKQETKVKYVSRRQVWDVKLFKVFSGAYFEGSIIRQYRTTATITPPDCYLPQGPGYEDYSKIKLELGSGWYVVSTNAVMRKDGSCRIDLNCKKYHKWELHGLLQ